MDTRAWRLPLPHTTIIEVDVPAVLKAKEQVLNHITKTNKKTNQPPPSLTVQQRRTVPADLAVGGPGEWVDQVKALLIPGEPVAVVMEGLLMYLTEEEVRLVLGQVGGLVAQATGSRVGISLVDTQSVRDAQASASPLRQTWRWGCDEHKAKAFFAQALSSSSSRGGGGWKVTHVTVVGEKGGFPGGANYGCWDNVGKWKRKGKTLYVLAERR